MFDAYIKADEPILTSVFFQIGSSSTRWRSTPIVFPPGNLWAWVFLFHVDAVRVSYLYLGGDELQLGCQTISSSKQFVQGVFPIRWLQFLNIF